MTTHLFRRGRPACAPDPSVPICGYLHDDPAIVTCDECASLAEGEALPDDEWASAEPCRGRVGGLPCPERAEWYAPDGTGICVRCLMDGRVVPDTF